MPSLIHGAVVILHIKRQTGVDEFNAPTYSEVSTPVYNVLISPVSASDMVDDTKLHGKTAVYELSIPKTDDHDWTDCCVEFYGKKWQTVGYPQQLMTENTPLDWDKKVKVAVYG